MDLSKRVRGGALVLALAAAVLTGCDRDSGHEDTPPPSPPRPAPVGQERGQIVSSSTVTDAHPETAAIGASAQRVTYLSTSGVDGSGVEVVATIFTPPGTAPEEGWPVVTIGHGTTGVTDDCAPSGSGDLRGSAALAGTFLHRGYVVAVSDYQGLGTDDPHPYLEPNSSAYDLIDAVRAAGNAVPDASTRWAALGISQGGQASWAAAELVPEYGDGLDFVGAANLSPAADLSHIINDSGIQELTIAQTMFMPYLLEGLRVSEPDFEISAYLRGPIADASDVTLSCINAKLVEKADLLQKISPGDIGPSTSEDTENLRGWLQERALPRQPSAGPLFVAVGTEDQLVLPQWTQYAVTRACEMGDVVEFHINEGERHADARAVPAAVDWVTDRFAGLPAPNTCPVGDGE